MISPVSDNSAPDSAGETSEPAASAVIDQKTGPNHHLVNADCIEFVSALPDDSVHYSIFSPPFSSLYVYSNSDRDMGNSTDYEQFSQHFSFLVPQLARVIKPGRLISVHCMNLPTTKAHDGYIGIQDFRGDLIRCFQQAGMIYHSEVTIWKDPVVAMQRTKALGLLHKQIVKDSAMSRQGIPDYILNFMNPGEREGLIDGNAEDALYTLFRSVTPESVVTFRKDGDNQEPISGEFDHFAGDSSGFSPTGRLSIDIWQRYASPIWMDINQSETLQYRKARDDKDERHLCPLQLPVIHRCLQLWTNPGDTVLSPFAGIGSEGFESIKLGRRFLGSELKPSYFKLAGKHLDRAETERVNLNRGLFNE